MKDGELVPPIVETKLPPTEPLVVDAPPRIDGAGLVLVVNPASGSGTGTRVLEQVRRELPAAEIAATAAGVGAFAFGAASKDSAALVALKLDLTWMDRRVEGAARDKCHAMAGLIDRAVENVGRIITDLRPSVLDHQGLWAALEWQAHDFVQSAELALESLGVALLRHAGFDLQSEAAVSAELAEV